MIKHIIYISIFVIIGCFISATIYAGEETVANFTLRDMDGNNFNLEDVLGKKIILINFWATWCIPCQQEFPHLEKLFNKYQKDDFLLLAITVDGSSTKARVKPFIKRHKYTFTVLHDTDSKVINRFNPKIELPYSLLVGKDKKIKYQQAGYQPGDEKHIEELVTKLVKEGGAK